MKDKLSLIIAKVGRKLLRMIFDFEDWHTSILAERPYAVDIVNYCNARRDRSRAIEIGCGLGEILRGLDYADKTGLDADGKVIGAARFMNRLNSGRIRFHIFKFPTSKLEGRADVIIMVNWPFFFDNETLKKGVENYFQNNLSGGGVLIIDTVQDTFYPNNHKINELVSALKAKVIKIGSYDRQREVWAIEKI